jgi:N-glycosylase/DNA lyase
MTGSVSMLRDSGPEVILSPVGFPSRSVRWGHCWQVGTPAYWVALTASAERDGRLGAGDQRHQLGRSLVEEIAACLLGGHGMPYQIGLAAFEAVRAAGLLSRPSNAEQIEAVLRLPLPVGERMVRYRFPAQRARYLAGALALVMNEVAPGAPRALRDWLLELPGVGPKTAGWIVRNHLNSDDVAIIDIHLLRAGVAAAVFDPDWTPAQHYRQLEATFLAWAHEGRVRAADLDAVIWAERARTPRAYRVLDQLVS